MRPARLLFAFAALLAGCAAARPALYPNRQLEDAGPVAAQQAIDDCLAAAADAGFGAHPAGRTAASAARTAATGAAVGAAAGAVRGHAGRGAAMGGAGGGAGGFMRGLFAWRDPDPLQVRFVNFCLEDQGYRVLGWR